MILCKLWLAVAISTAATFAIILTHHPVCKHAKTLDVEVEAREIENNILAIQFHTLITVPLLVSAVKLVIHNYARSSSMYTCRYSDLS